MQNNYQTSRLLLAELNLNDAEFISELVNTPEWKRFIGDRNIKTREAANEYVRKIMGNPNIHYWVVKIQEQQIPIGVITFIKRDYLEHYDIGFAFLEKYTKKGYAYEATIAVMNDAMKDGTHSHILATTVKENVNSIQLLEKLGLRFENEIEREDETLLVYAVATDKLAIDNLTKQFFNLFTNTNQRQLDLNSIYDLCLAKTIIIKKNKLEEVIYNLDSFIEPRKKILSDGTLTEFEESETNEETKIVGNIAQRFSKYQKKGFLNGTFFQEYGTKLFQFVKTKEGWRINSLIWEDDQIINNE
jgi:RimJ/RimL family protein N-acetyltransferase